jgi:hypothetical protein
MSENKHGGGSSETLPRTRSGTDEHLAFNSMDVAEGREESKRSCHWDGTRYSCLHVNPADQELCNDHLHGAHGDCATSATCFDRHGLSDVLLQLCLGHSLRPTRSLLSLLTSDLLASVLRPEVEALFWARRLELGLVVRRKRVSKKHVLQVPAHKPQSPGGPRRLEP